MLSNTVVILMERVMITLTASEGKRIIAKAVAREECVIRAMEKGTVVVCPGTTNAYVLESLTGKRLEAKGKFAIGIVTPSGTCVTKAGVRMREAVLRCGELSEMGIKEVIGDLDPEDVFIKGANAIDPMGNAGVYLGSETGGTIGMSIGTLLARGVNVVVPASLEKLVPFPIAEIVPRIGNRRFRASMGLPVGMMQLPGKVITEIDAISSLFMCDCIPLGGSEGNRCYSIEGDEGAVKEAWDFISSIKGEPAISFEKEDCSSCRFKCRKVW